MNTEKGDKLLNDFLNLKPCRLKLDVVRYTFLWKDWIVVIYRYSEQNYHMEITIDGIYLPDNYINISKDSYKKVERYWRDKNHNLSTFQKDVTKALNSLKLKEIDGTLE